MADPAVAAPTPLPQPDLPQQQQQEQGQGQQQEQEQEQEQQQRQEPQQQLDEESVAQHARVATLLYDLRVRPIYAPTLPSPFPPSSPVPVRLRVAYPAAAALADHLALSALANPASAHSPFFPSFPTASPSAINNLNYSDALNNINLHNVYNNNIQTNNNNNNNNMLQSVSFRRVNSMSVARVFALAGALLFSLRLWVILSLALASALAKSSDNPAAGQYVEQLVESVLARTYDHELYLWLLGLLVDDAQPSRAFHGAFIETPDPPVFVLAFLSSPFLAGFLCYLVGLGFAAALNTVLSLVGGIRVEQPILQEEQRRQQQHQQQLQQIQHQQQLQQHMQRLQNIDRRLQRVNARLQRNEQRMQLQQNQQRQEQQRPHLA